MSKKRKKSRGKPPRRSGSGQRRRAVAVPQAQPTDLDREWSRTGAANVGGVTYQVAATAWILIAGRAGRLDVDVVTPEGYEDIDCLTDKGRLLVQAKDRLGSGPVTNSLLAEVVAHAWDGISAGEHFALVTDVETGSQLEFTGWDQTLIDVLDQERADAVAKAIAKKLPGEVDNALGTAKECLSRVQVVEIPWTMAASSVLDLASTYDIVPAVAALVHSRLFQNIANIASVQRNRDQSRPISMHPTDLDALVTRVLETVDIDALDATVRAGIAAPVDFSTRSSETAERFLAGLDAAPAHIAAGLDLPRPTELRQIVEGLRHSRYALIVGPSGSGKSVLLWRTARDITGGVRAIRVHRAQESDRADLIRYVRLLEPSPEAPVVVCADNLGRSETSAWIAIASELLEIPGVSILGACRAEDFSPALAIGQASVCTPTLDSGLAYAISETLESRDVGLHLDATEALAEADGLLMEYIFLLTSGRRLKDVLREQVSARHASERHTELRTLRYVSTAHAYGCQLSAEALGRLLEDAVDLAEALARLDEELLVVTNEKDGWVGLHELRSDFIQSAIHSTPPPTRPETVADLVAVQPGESGRTLIRTYAQTSDDDLTLVAERVSDIVRDATARAAAELFEALADADAARCAKQCLELARDDPRLRSFRVLSVALEMRWIEGSALQDLMPEVAAFAERPPEQSFEYRRLAVERSTPDIVRLAAAANTPDAIRLLESIECDSILDQDQAADLWNSHRGGNLALTARLAATLVRNADLDESSWADTLGPRDERVKLLGAVHPSAVRSHATEADDGLCVTLELLGPREADWGEPLPDELADLGTGDAHAQAVASAGWILDLCPEAQFAEVITLAPDGERYEAFGHEPAHKRIPRENLPRDSDTRHNAHQLDTVRRLLAARSWTERLRLQAEVADQIQTCLDQVPDRLLARPDNQGRRKKWSAVITELNNQVEQLPEPPGKDLDRTSEDHAQKALSALASALRDLDAALGTTDTHRFRLIGSQLRAACAALESAWLEGQPSLSSVGDPLPVTLRESAVLAADLLLAGAEDPDGARQAKSRKRSGLTWATVGASIVQDARDEVLSAERALIDGQMSDLPTASIRRVDYADPKGLNLVTDRWVVVAPIEETEALVEQLQSVAAAEPSLAHRTFGLVTASEKVVPCLGWRVGTSDLFPLEPEDIASLAQDANLHLQDDGAMTLAQGFVNSVVAVSHTNALRGLRDPALGEPPYELDRDELIARAERQANQLPGQFCAEASESLLGAVQNERAAPAEPNLAGELYASLRGEPTSEAVAVLNAVVLEATLVDATE